MNTLKLPKHDTPVKEKSGRHKSFVKTSVKSNTLIKDHLREARAMAILNLIKASDGLLPLTGRQYSFLRRQYGLTKADIDSGLNFLLDNNQILVRANAGFVLLEAM